MLCGSVLTDVYFATLYLVLYFAHMSKVASTCPVDPKDPIKDYPIKDYLKSKVGPHVWIPRIL